MQLLADEYAYERQRLQLSMMQHQAKTGRATAEKEVRDAQTVASEHLARELDLQERLAAMRPFSVSSSLLAGTRGADQTLVSIRHHEVGGGAPTPQVANTKGISDRVV